MLNKTKSKPKAQKWRQINHKLCPHVLDSWNRTLHTHAQRLLLSFHETQPHVQSQRNAVSIILRTSWSFSPCCPCLFESFLSPFQDFMCWHEIFKTKVISETALRKHVATFGRMNLVRFCMPSGATIFGPRFRDQNKTRIEHIPGPSNSGPAWGCACFRAVFGHRILGHVFAQESTAVASSFQYLAKMFQCCKNSIMFAGHNNPFPQNKNRATKWYYGLIQC